MIDNSRTIALHDQWLTATPYDDEPDWSDSPWFVVCPECESESFSDEGGDYPILSFQCDDCGHEWTQNVEKPNMTPEQEERFNKLSVAVSEARSYRVHKKGMTVDEFFESLGQDGDFHWDAVEAGDWHVYNCGEKDCPVQWHLIAFAEKIGMENGKRYIHIEDLDSDGNWEYNTGYDERDGDTPDMFCDVADMMANQSDRFFLGWAEYWLDCAETGNDPCEQTLSTPDNWVDFCLDGVEDNLKYCNK